MNTPFATPAARASRPSRTLAAPLLPDGAVLIAGGAGFGGFPPGSLG